MVILVMDPCLLFDVCMYVRMNRILTSFQRYLYVLLFYCSCYHSSLFLLGTGYGSSHDVDNDWDPTICLRIAAAKTQHQSSIIDVLNAFLKVPFDNLLPDKKLLYERLEASCLVPLLMSYLRNDSMVEIMKQTQLYNSLFSLLRSLAKDDQLILLLTNYPGESSSIESLFKKMIFMASFLLKSSAIKLTSNGSVAVGGDGDEEKDIKLAKTIVETGNFLLSALDTIRSGKQIVRGKAATSTNTTSVTPTTTTTVASVKVPNKNIQESYREALEPLQFAEMSMKYSGSINSNNNNKYRYYFASHIESETSSGPAKMKRLLQEIASLSNGLPLCLESSIFVRVDDERPGLYIMMIDCRSCCADVCLCVVFAF